MIKALSILFLVVVTLMIYSTGLFASCCCDTEKDHHDPACDDNSCIFCFAGFVDVDIYSKQYNNSFNNSRPYSFTENIVKAREIVFDLDQPPKA